MKLIFNILGFASFSVGLIGIFVPVLPTTPFMILAVFFFGKGSIRFQKWIESDPLIGPHVLNWRKHGVIPLRGKLLASGTLITSFAIMVFVMQVSTLALLSFLLLAVSVMAFLWSRPSEPPSEKAETITRLPDQ